MIDESHMTLGVDWHGQSLVGWLASEKHDGCRAFWDGHDLWTRNGNCINAPGWFTDALPPAALDGEIWCGRNDLAGARMAVQYGRFTRAHKFIAFDAPPAPGTWAQRMATITPSAAVKPVEFWEVATMRELRVALANILRDGGEGLVLRNPVAMGYEIGRTGNMVKVKRWI